MRILGEFLGKLRMDFVSVMKSLSSFLSYGTKKGGGGRTKHIFVVLKQVIGVGQYFVS